MPVVEGHPYEAQIWAYLMWKLDNPVGAAAMMGNWRNESANYPNRLQGSHVGDGTSEEYTAKVDSGEVSRDDFIHNGPGGGGYGLAQWTYWTRKRNMYDLWKSGGYGSIGELQLGLDFWWWEMNNGYGGTKNALLNATNIRTATVYVLKNYEKPANQGQSAQDQRTKHAEQYYNYYYLNVDPDTPVPEVPEPGDPGFGSSGSDFIKRYLTLYRRR